MPYIKQEDRERLFATGCTAKNAGELNFIISLLIDQYWHENGKNYQAFNDIIGALNNAEHEYYRRKISYYEMAKMAENGDVYSREEIPIVGEGAANPPAQEPLRKGPSGSKVPATSGPEQTPRPGADL